jgi:hypothetical protein
VVPFVSVVDCGATDGVLIGGPLAPRWRTFVRRTGRNADPAGAVAGLDGPNVSSAKRRATSRHQKREIARRLAKRDAPFAVGALAAWAVGGVLAGIVGGFVAVPTAAVIAATFDYYRPLIEPQGPCRSSSSRLACSA